MIAHLHVNWLAPVKVRRTLHRRQQKMIVYDDLEPSEKVKVYDKGITVNGGKDERRNGQRHAMLVGYRTGDVWAPQLDVTEALGVEAAPLRRVRHATTNAPVTDGARRAARRPAARGRDPIDARSAAGSSSLPPARCAA